MSATTPRYPDRDRNAEGKAENRRPRDRFGAPLPRDAVDEMAHRDEPEDVVDTQQEALTRAIELFDAERFFETHEFAEYIWKHEELDPADRDFWKGVAQVAVGCCHVQRGNATGAVTLLHRAADYLRQYDSPRLGVDPDALIALAGRVAARVERAVSPDAVRFEPFPRA